MDTLHNEIVNVVRENKENYNLSEQSLAALILYSISQDEYFKNNYHFLSIAEMENGDFEVFQPNLSYIRGFTNQRTENNLISIYFPHERFEEESELDNEEYYDYDDSDNYIKDVKHVYLNEKILEKLNKFTQFLENTNTLQEFLELFHTELESDPTLIHYTQRYIGNEHTGHNEPINKLFTFIKHLTEIGTVEDHNLHSQIFCKDKERRGLFSKFITDSFLYRDTLNAHALSELVSLNSFKVSNILKDDNNDTLSHYDLFDVYKDDNLDKCPDDISEMIRNKEPKKDIFNAFKNNYKSTKLDIILSFSKPKNKELDLIEFTFKQIKEKCLEDIKLLVENKYQNENDFLQRYNIEPLVKQVKNKYLEFTNSRYSISTGFSNADKSMWVSVPALYDEMISKEKLAIYSEDYSDLYTKGLEMADPEGFKAGCSKDKIYFFARTENSTIGVASCAISNNTLDICNVSIAHYARNKGVMTNIYREMADYAVNHNLVISTSMYTDNGRSFIPSAKHKIMNENENVLFLTSDQRQTDGFEQMLCEVSESLTRILSTTDKKIDLKKLTKTFKSFKEEMEKDFNNQDFENQGYSAKYDFQSKHLSILEEKLKSVFVSKKPKMTR